MKVDILKPIGYCLGVTKAINQAIKIKEKYKDKNVYVFGSLVHNENVINDLNKRGIISLDIKNPIEQLKKFTSDDIVIFTAHGHDESYEEILKKNQVTFFDTTCEKVKNNLDVIKVNISRGVIYVGKNNHPETLASLSISDKIYFYDLNKGMDFTKVKHTNPLIINQTTLSILELKNIHQEIINYIPGALIADEICSATRIRQEKLINLNKNYDLILIVGSVKSSNTDKLYQMVKLNHPKIDCFKINSVEELKNINLNNYHYALIASGTSTPISVVNEIENKLKES